MPLHRILVNVSELVNVLTILLFLINYQRSGKVAKAMALHVGLLLFCNTSALFLASAGFNNYFLLHILTFLDLLVVSYFYNLLVPYKAKAQVVFLSMIGLLLAACLLDSFYLSSLKAVNVFSVTITGAFKVYLVVRYMTYRLHPQDLDILDRVSNDIPKNKRYVLGDMFSVGLLLYTASSALFFLFLNMMIEYQITKPFIKVNAGFYLLSASLYCYSFWRYFWGKK